MLFKLADCEFEDVRLTSEEWKQQKTSGKYPLEQVPIFEVDGVTLCQSYAIEKFVANEVSLQGQLSIHT